jgi:hypothetical protein
MRARWLASGWGRGLANRGLAGRRLLVHTNPASGAYANVAGYSERETASPLAAPQAKFRVADAFPAAG